MRSKVKFKKAHFLQNKVSRNTNAPHLVCDCSEQSEGEVPGESIHRSSPMALAPTRCCGLLPWLLPAGSPCCSSAAVLSASPSHAQSSYPCAAVLARRPQPWAQGTGQLHCDGQLWGQQSREGMNYQLHKPSVPPTAKASVSLCLHGSADAKPAEHPCCALLSRSWCLTGY